MKPRMNENEKRITITCKKAIVDEAKAQGFERIDAYIQHLKARINELEAQLQQTTNTSKPEAPDKSTSGAAPEATK